jgi:hypothetical protein
VKQVVDADGVVVGRVGPVVYLNVKLLIMHQHVVEGMPKRKGNVLLELVVNVFISQEEVGGL